MTLQEAVQNLIAAIDDLEKFIPKEVPAFKEFFGRMWIFLGTGLEELEKYYEIKK